MGRPQDQTAKLRRNAVQLTWPPTTTAALTTSEVVARVDGVTASTVTNAPTSGGRGDGEAGIEPADGQQRHRQAAEDQETAGPHRLGRHMRRNRRQQPGGHGAGQRTAPTAALAAAVGSILAVTVGSGGLPAAG